MCLFGQASLPPATAGHCFKLHTLFYCLPLRKMWQIFKKPTTDNVSTHSRDRSIWEPLPQYSVFSAGFTFFFCCYKCHGQCLVPVFLQACLIISFRQIPRSRIIGSKSNKHVLKALKTVFAKLLRRKLLPVWLSCLQRVGRLL